MRHDFTVSEAAAQLRDCTPDDIPAMVLRFAQDQRSGVREAVLRAQRRLARHTSEVERLESLFLAERDLHDRGFAVVAGVDEVGRGAIAGPVTAGAAVLTCDTLIDGLDDSKRIPRPKREVVARAITERAMAVSVSHVPASRVDEIGIVPATHEAMESALDGLGLAVDHVIVDGKDAQLRRPFTTIVGGDASCAAIAAASVVAKVERDRLMVEYAERYPGYGFECHRGYCTEEHVHAIQEIGPSPIHRLSFEPCRERPTLF